MISTAFDITPSYRIFRFDGQPTYNEYLDSRKHRDLLPSRKHRKFGEHIGEIIDSFEPLFRTALLGDHQEHKDPVSPPVVYHHRRGRDRPWTGMNFSKQS